MISIHTLPRKTLLSSMLNEQNHALAELTKIPASFLISHIQEGKGRGGGDMVGNGGMGWMGFSAEVVVRR